MADFKCPTEYNWNTLQKALKHGFEQAGTVVLFPDGIVYDANILKSAIGYLLRNDKPIGNLILINEYGKILEIDRIEIRSGLLNKKLKGFY